MGNLMLITCPHKACVTVCTYFTNILCINNNSSNSSRFNNNNNHKNDNNKKTFIVEPKYQLQSSKQYSEILGKEGGNHNGQKGFNF